MNIVEKNSSLSLAELAMECLIILDAHYPKEIIFLEFKNPYETVISVALSAQTTDRQVNSVIGELFSLYPDAFALAQGDVERIESIIRSVGFFKVKARNIVAAAKMLVADFNGEVPKTIEELILLPGVGRKSANVVVGHCFGVPAVIVDTHFGRVVRRLGLTVHESPEKVETDIRNLLLPQVQYRFSMTINAYGRDICHARNPQCGNCFLADLCRFDSKLL